VIRGAVVVVCLGLAWPQAFGMNLSRDRLATGSGLCGATVNVARQVRVVPRGNCTAETAARVQALWGKVVPILGPEHGPLLKRTLIASVIDDYSITVMGLEQRAASPRALALDRRALVLLKRGDTSAAAASALRELARPDSNEKASEFEWNVFLELTDRRRVLAELERSLAESDDFNARWKAANLALDLDDPARALRHQDRMAQLAEAELKKTPDARPWLRNRAIAHYLTGDVHRDAGRHDAALQGYRAGRLIAHRLVSEVPTDTQYLRDLFIVDGRIGSMMSSMDDLAGALASHLASLDSRRKLALAEPDKREWSDELAAGHALVGNIQERQGDRAAALESYQAAVAVARPVAAATPKNANRQYKLSTYLGQAGEMQSAQGDHAGAVQSHRDALVILRSLSAKDPKTVKYKIETADQLDQLGDAQEDLKDLDGALESHRAALALRRELRTLEPKNTYWQDDVAASLTDIARLRWKQDDHAGAQTHFEEALAIKLARAAAAPGNLSLQRDLQWTHKVIGSVRRSQRDMAGALASFEKSLAIADRLAPGLPIGDELHAERGLLHTRIGDMQAELDRPTRSLNSYRAGLHIRTELLKAAPDAAEKQRDFALSIWKIACLKDSGLTEAERKTILEDGLRTLAEIEQRGRLAADNVVWLDRFRDGAKEQP
jgi:tetratricopeptide (TPR) repeat protein